MINKSKGDEVYWKFKASGAEHSMLVSMDRNYFKKEMQSILRSRRARIVRNMINPMELLRALSEAGERGTRIVSLQEG